MRGPLSGAAETYNYIEIGIWCAIAVIAAMVALRRTGPARRDGLVASIALVAFGVSDYAEIRTGGEWWRPWWLLAWKATCLAVLLALLLAARRRRRSGAVVPAEPARRRTPVARGDSVWTWNVVVSGLYPGWFQMEPAWSRPSFARVGPSWPLVSGGGGVVGS
jgi:hypothetical protein